MMTQYSGIPSISRYAKWLLNIPSAEMVVFIYPVEVTFWVELWGLRVSVTTTASLLPPSEELHISFSYRSFFIIASGEKFSKLNQNLLLFCLT